MCRLYGFRANEPTKVECTLVHAQNALLIQSRSDLRGVSHTDGWGIAVFEDGRPLLEKRGGAAYEDLHFSSTAERIYSNTVVAHVRRATVGRSSPLNAHPFSYGRWVFAHNGTVTGFETLGPELRAETDPDLERHRQGRTDSEQAFVWLLSRLRRAGLDLDAPCSDVQVLAEVVARSVHELANRSDQSNPDEGPRLNFLLTDGASMVASRWHNGLHMVVREGVHDCEICGIPHVHHAPGVGLYRAVVIASEPISDEAWMEVPDEHVVSVSPEFQISTRPVAEYVIA